MNENQFMDRNAAEIFTLQNGLRVIGERLPYLRTVSVGLWLRTGAMHELPKENGLSHYLEHMVFKGTETRSARQISQEMDSVGGSMNAFTAKDATCFYCKVIDTDLPLAIDLLADLATHATLDQKELRKERGVILQEIAMDEDSPEDVVSDLLAEAQFGNQSLGQTILGRAEQVASYTRRHLAAYRAKHYCPRDAVLSVCGNYTTEQLKELAEKYFGGWHNELPPYHVDDQQPMTGRTLLRNKDIEQMHLCLGWPGMTCTDHNQIDLNAASSILGGAMTSRLFQRIREELGACYTIYSFSNCYEPCGTLGVYAGVNPASTRMVLDEIRKQIDLFLKKGVTAQEVKDVKTQMLAGMLMSLQSSGACMQTMGRSLLLRGYVTTLQERIDRVNAVTAESIMAAVRPLLSQEPCLVLLGPDAEQFAL